MRAALSSRCFERVVVSTDGAEIAEAARAAGAEVPFMRPAALAGPGTASTDVLRHVFETLGPVDRFALLQPTSPFRSAAHVREAAASWDAATDALVSVTDAKPASWRFVMEEGSGRLRRPRGADVAARRQDAAGHVVPNGALYLCRHRAFAQAGSLFPDGARGYPMGRIDSIDIDTLEDFQMAEAVVSCGLRRWEDG